MALTGRQFEDLTNLINEAFTLLDLVMLVQFRLGLKQGEWYSDGIPLKGNVFNLITMAEMSGSTATLVEAVMTARPEREDIQRVLRAILTGLAPGAPNTTQVQIVADGLDGVVRGMDIKAVRELVQQSAEVLKKLADDLAQLRAYKALHDNLHFVQMQFRSFASSARKLLKDPVAAVSDLSLALDQLKSFADKAQTAITQLPDQPPAVRAIEQDWLNRLNQAIDLAQEAADHADPLKGGAAAGDVKGLLRQEPTRIDRVLILTADALKLDGLKEVFEKAASLATGRKKLSEDLVQGRQAAEGLLRSIKALVNQHTQWQQIDRSLWSAEDSMPRGEADDPSDFDAAWMAIKRRLAELTGTDPASKWAGALNARSTKVDERRREEDWPKLTLDFARLRQESIVQFFVIDTSLRDLTGEVDAISVSLRILLDQLDMNKDDSQN